MTAMIDGETGLDTPMVVETAALSAAVIRLTVPRADLPKVMGPAIGDLAATLQAQGIPPSGALFARHVRLDDAVFDLEVGFPVGGAVTAVGRVVPGGLPAATVVRATYHGGYEGLARAWGALRRWMELHRHTSAAEFWEVYAVGPATAPAPADWRTVLHQPLTT